MKTNSEKIKEEAIRLGFSDCGISKTDLSKSSEQIFTSWLLNNYHAEMQYMENNIDKRVDVRKLVENAKSVVSVILSYNANEIYHENDSYKISKYAYGKDYHKVMKDKLFALKDFIDKNITESTGRAFVDSAPIFDRAYAQKSGLGWIGKNSVLINKTFGSFIFIGELVLDLELDYNESINSYCGTCTKCIDACPTSAIVEPYVVDANKCISYLNIENKGELPPDLQGQFNNYIFGCDICQDVCPWNKKTPLHKTEEFNASNFLKNLSNADWENLSKEEFNFNFKESPLKRRKYEGIMRNIHFVKKDVTTNL